MVGTARRAVRASRRDAPTSEEFCPAPWDNSQRKGGLTKSPPLPQRVGWTNL